MSSTSCNAGCLTEGSQSRCFAEDLKRDTGGGIVLDAPDPQALGLFYGEMLGGDIYREQAERS